MTTDTYRGLKAKRNGSGFERLIEVTCAVYKNIGKAHIQKTPEPFKLLKKKGKQAIGVYEKKAQPDFTGTIKGGRSIVFEAKHTDSTNVPFDRLSPAQEKDLAYHDHLGAVALVVISFSLKRFYAVPWTDWKHLKDTSGKKSVNEKDLAEYGIEIKGGLLDLLKEGEG